MDVQALIALLIGGGGLTGLLTLFFTDKAGRRESALQLIDQLQESYKEQREEIEILKQESKAMREKLDAMQKENSEKARLIMTYESERLEYQRRIEVLTAELTEKNKEIQKQNDFIILLQKERNGK